MTPKIRIRIGTRGSPLALRQTEQVAAELGRCYPDWNISLVRVKTKGDLFLDASFSQIGGKGVFVKEIEEALLAGAIDLAVHSMKDLPTDLPPGLCLAAITRREDPRDCLISKDGWNLEELPHGACIGTSSVRRQAQIRNFRPDLQIHPLRGNLGTRIRKLTSEGLDGIILASAGLHRLGMQDLITQYLPLEICLPAAGQGSLGIEMREADEELKGAVSVLCHEESACSVGAERALLSGLGGGCQIPIGAFGQVEVDKLHLYGVICNPEGTRVIRGELTGTLREGERLGEDLAEQLWPQAKEILEGK
jgi:hydroxymethylbilane synthase